MTPEARKLLLDSEAVFLRAAREHSTIRAAYKVGLTEEDMDLGQMALLAIPALLHEITELRKLAVLAPPKPFTVRKSDITPKEPI